MLSCAFCLTTGEHIYSHGPSIHSLLQGTFFLSAGLRAGQAGHAIIQISEHYFYKQLKERRRQMLPDVEDHFTSIQYLLASPFIDIHQIESRSVLTCHMAPRGILRSLKAFTITEIELKLMAAAAIIGLSNNPKIG